MVCPIACITDIWVKIYHICLVYRNGLFYSHMRLHGYKLHLVNAILILFPYGVAPTSFNCFLSFRLFSKVSVMLMSASQACRCLNPVSWPNSSIQALDLLLWLQRTSLVIKSLYSQNSKFIYWCFQKSGKGMIQSFPHLTHVCLSLQSTSTSKYSQL